jgi:hypothetical protein
VVVTFIGDNCWDLGFEDEWLFLGVMVDGGGNNIIVIA